MKVWEPHATKHFLKSVGSADDPMADDWVDNHPQELSVVHFTKEPKSIRVGDLLVYYAGVHQKLLGIVEVFSKPQLDAQHKRWPHYCEIRPKLIIKDFDRAPSIDVLNSPDGKRDFRKVVQQLDYAALEDAEWELAVAALETAWDPGKGDLGSPLTSSAPKP